MKKANQVRSNSAGARRGTLRLYPRVEHVDQGVVDCRKSDAARCAQYVVDIKGAGLA